MRAAFAIVAVALIVTSSRVCAAAAANCALSPLIDREALSESAQPGNPRVSADGRHVAYLARGERSAEIVIAPRRRPSERRKLPVQPMAGIQQFEFTSDGRSVLLLADEQGDEQYRLYVVDIDSGVSRPLTPQGAQVSLERIGARGVRQVVVSMNDRDPEYFDPVRIDIDTGERTRLLENDRFSAYVIGPDLRPVMASRLEPDGGKTWYRLTVSGDATVFRRLAAADTIGSGLGDVSADGRSLAFVDSTERAHTVVKVLDIVSGRESLGAPERTDVSNYIADLRTGKVLAVEYDELTPRWVALDRRIGRAFDRIARESHGDRVRILSRSADDSIWVVATSGPQQPGATYLYDRATEHFTLWFADYSDIPRDRLAPMHVRRIQARDGLDVPVYYTLPLTPGKCEPPRGGPRWPAVVWVHGGPWDRDRWDFRLDHQLLANRGYAVISVNFRGSTGYGKGFVAAGDGEWGRKMQEDVADAVDALVADGTIDANRVAILGSSYGGYAVLAALAFTPTTYACGVSVVGPSNLVTLIEGIPPYWTATRSLYTARVGDPASATGRALLEARSPLRAADQVRRPLLLVHGANDPRVPERESKQMAEAVRAADGPVSLLLFPDEGHGIARPANARALTAIVEAFLASCVGGRAQPVGNAIEGSSLQVPLGRELLPGLDPVPQ